MSYVHQRIARVLPAIVMALSLLAGPAAAGPSDQEKLQLQAAVLGHIEDHTDSGIYHFIDPQNTDLVKLRFVAMHPVVFERKDGTFALCADFKDAGGKEYLLDYYVQRLRGQYVVLSSVVGKRSLLMKLAEKFDL